MKTREYLLIFKSSLVQDVNAMKCSLSRLIISIIQCDDDKGMNSFQNLLNSSTIKNSDEFRMNSLNKIDKIATSIVKSIQR